MNTNIQTNCIREDGIYGLAEVVVIWNGLQLAKSWVIGIVYPDGLYTPFVSFTDEQSAHDVYATEYAVA